MNPPSTPFRRFILQNYSRFLIIPLLILFFLALPINNSIHSSLAAHPRSISISQPSLHGSAGKIVFSALREGNWDLWIMNPDGSNLFQLTDTPFDERAPCISNDGEKIVYSTSKGDLWAIMLRPGLREKISLPVGYYGSPIWLNKTTILFVSFVFGITNNKVYDDSSLMRFDLEKETTNANPYILIDQMGIQDWPSSFANNDLLYSSSVQGPNQEITQEIWTYDFTNKQGDQLTLLNANSIQPKWSPDGKEIVFSSNKTGNFEIWKYCPTTKKVIRLTNSDWTNKEPSWSPDGKTIIFVSNRRGPKEIWKMSPDGEIMGVISPFKEATECENPFWGTEYSKEK